MKRTKWIIFTVVIVLIAVMYTNALAQTHHEFDKKTYVRLTKKNIGRILTGKVNPDTMLADMEQLLDLGIQGCKDHMSEPETPKSEARMLQYTIDAANKMKSMSLEQIEEQWHEGGYLKSKGIDISKMDHFDEVMCHYDSIVHPATAIICLQEYKKSNNEELLEQMKAELAEVAEHMKHLD
jgi:hypothetical protein